MSIAGLIFLVAVTAAWLLIPLLPAIRELVRPTDTEPLRVVSRDSADIAFFANNFRQYFHSQVEQFDFSSLTEAQPSTFSDGTPFVCVKGASPLPLVRTGAMTAVDHLVIAADKTALPDDVLFQREVYGVQSVTGGVRSAYRAVLAEEELTLREGSVVLRWAHSLGRFSVMSRSMLYGRASSSDALFLEPNVGFQWIAAPVICVGMPDGPDTPSPARHKRRKGVLEQSVQLSGDTCKVAGDITIPAGCIVEKNLVVMGQITIEPGARIKGSVKSHSSVEISEGVVIDGSLIARSTISVGSDCQIAGPVISEGTITIAHGCRIGSKEKPSTVSAKTVTLHSGVTVSGMVVAQESGITVL